MSLMGTLGKVAMGVIVAKGVGKMLGAGGGAGGSGGGLGGLLGSLTGGNKTSIKQHWWPRRSTRWTCWRFGRRWFGRYSGFTGWQFTRW